MEIKLKFSIICVLFLYTISSHSQTKLLGLETNLLFCSPRNFEYDLKGHVIEKILIIPTNSYSGKYYHYKENGISYEVGLVSQLKLLRHWNLISKVKYSNFQFTGWHYFKDSSIQIPNNDKIFYFDLDKINLHSIRTNVGINFHFKSKILFQFSPVLLFNIAQSSKQAKGVYANNYQSPATSSYIKNKNDIINLSPLAFGVETEVSAIIYKNISIFLNYAKIKNYYKENTGDNYRWFVRSYAFGIRYYILGDKN